MHPFAVTLLATGFLLVSSSPLQPSSKSTIRTSSNDTISEQASKPIMKPPDNLFKKSSVGNNGTSTDKQQVIKTAQATSYFTDLGPNGFVYRGLFDHGKGEGIPKGFSPFVNEYPDFPIGGFEEIFRRKSPSTTSSPVIYPPFGGLFKQRKAKTAPGPPSLPNIDILRQGIPLEPPDVPLFAFPKYDVYKGKAKPDEYPKIFRFTDGRINLADFDRKKKIGKDYLSLRKGDEIDPDKIARNKFLILHGGLYNRKDVPSRRAAVLTNNDEYVNTPHHHPQLLLPPPPPYKRNYNDGYSYYIWP